MYDVAVARCDDYSDDNVNAALNAVISAIGGLDFIKEGMTVAIKANLVSFMKPDAAATTHPSLLCCLVRLLREKGAKVIVGDSPGGLYNSVFVNRVYNATGMREVEKAGAVLNEDFSQAEAVFPEAAVAKDFRYTAYLDKADVIIDFCKLKTHGMMGMSAAAKNLFGTIPGTVKPEYHYRFPNAADFARMIVDLNEYFKPCISIVDAVVGMEGNGPTMGTPRKIGAVLASQSPHKLDLACAAIIGLTPDDVPTLKAAAERGLVTENYKELNIYGKLEDFFISDYKNIAVKNSIMFNRESTKFFGKLSALFIGSALRSKPGLSEKDCIGCGKCAQICPAKAITINEKHKAQINRDKCIRCFCCQEFCPKGAMKVKRTLIARVLNK